MVDTRDQKTKRKLDGALHFAKGLSAFVAIISFVTILWGLPAYWVMAVSNVPIFIFVGACLTFALLRFVEAWY